MRAEVYAWSMDFMGIHLREVRKAHHVRLCNGMIENNQCFVILSSLVCFGLDKLPNIIFVLYFGV
jgi:hypothetical protein